MSRAFNPVFRLHVEGIVAGRGDPADIPARGNGPLAGRGLRSVRRPPGSPSHFCWMLVVPSPVEAIPLMSPPAEIDRFPGPDDESDDESADCPAQDAHPSAARAATATPSPAATTHRSAPDFSHNGNSNAPHTHRPTPNAATVTTTAISHLPARLILATPLTAAQQIPAHKRRQTRIQRRTPHAHQSRLRDRFPGLWDGSARIDTSTYMTL